VAHDLQVGARLSPDHALISDIGLDWGPLDIAAIALIIGAPGLVLCLAGFVWWKMSPWG
jgi:hypothetical protein